MTRLAYIELIEAVMRRDGRVCWLKPRLVGNRIDRPSEDPTAEYALEDFDAGECAGMFDACHLVSKQRIKRRWGADSVAVSDPDFCVLGCRRHHNMLDDRMARLPRSAVPERCEKAAALFELAWSLDRDFGPKA